MADLTLKTYDTYPSLVATLDEGGVALDLTTATSVVIVMKGNTSAAIITGTCTITDAANGVVTYTWGSTDTQQADTYQVEWMITWSSGSYQTVPNAAASNPTVEIDSRLDGSTG